MTPALSIVMPVLNEAAGVVAALLALQPMRQRGMELIVVDGGSRDGTLGLAAPLCDLVVTAERGRARQMNEGAQHAAGDILLFLHADTTLPDNADRLVVEALAAPGRCWGRFDVRIEGAQRLLRLVAAMMNRRSRMSGIATGDQAMFVRRLAFHDVGGFPDIVLMEDIGLSKRLKRIAPPVCLAERVVTSGRRWEKHGVLRTVLLMWRLRAAYALGADPAELARRYGYGAPDA